MTRFTAIVVVAALAGCATVRNYERLEQPTEMPLTASAGTIALRVQRSADLPNAYGGADIYGGKVDRGYAEVRYLGLGENGAAMFSVLDVRTDPKETAMDRYVVRPAVQINVNGAAQLADAIRVSVDMKTERSLSVSGVTLLITEARPSSIVYVLKK